MEAWCDSEWEGCACGRPKDHEPPHTCADEICDCEWTDEQATEWWKVFKAEIAEWHEQQGRGASG